MVEEDAIERDQGEEVRMREGNDVQSTFCRKPKHELQAGFGIRWRRPQETTTE
jgi:hypothetical protein